MQHYSAEDLTIGIEKYYEAIGTPEYATVSTPNYPSSLWFLLTRFYDQAAQRLLRIHRTNPELFDKETLQLVALLEEIFEEETQMDVGELFWPGLWYAMS